VKYVYNVYSTANRLHCMPVKEFWKSANNWRIRHGQK